MAKKKMRGKSYLRPEEPTKISCNLSLSKLAINKLEKLARKTEISKSEFIELLIRSHSEADNNLTAELFLKVQAPAKSIKQAQAQNLICSLPLQDMESLYVWLGDLLQALKKRDGAGER